MKQARINILRYFFTLKCTYTEMLKLIQYVHKAINELAGLVMKDQKTVKITVRRPHRYCDGSL